MHLGLATGLDEYLNDAFAALFELDVVVMTSFVFWATDTVEDVFAFAETTSPRTVATMK